MFASILNVGGCMCCYTNVVGNQSPSRKRAHDGLETCARIEADGLPRRRGSEQMTGMVGVRVVRRAIGCVVFRFEESVVTMLGMSQ